MGTNSSVIYSDKDSDKMRRRRKRNLILGYFILVTFSSIYTVFFLALIAFSIGDSMETMLIPIILVALSLPLFYWCLYYAAVREERKAVEYGVVLTENVLSIHGFEISMESILKVEVADFASGSHFLAIGYLCDSGKKKKTRTSLLWPKSTDDIWKLCNKIRDLRGWPEQENVQDYGFFGWSRWKALLKKAV